MTSPQDIEVPIAALSPAPLRFSAGGLATSNHGQEERRMAELSSLSGSTAYPAPVPGSPHAFEHVLRGPLAHDGPAGQGSHGNHDKHDSTAPLSVDDALRRDARIPSPAPNLAPTPPVFPVSSATPTGSQVRSLAGYERPRAKALDAPVASDLFGEGPGYEDFESSSPPTDDFTPHVLEDVGQPYATPYSVPEPPPIPGILDRFTPPPAQRTEIGSRRKKPEFLAETPQAKARYEPTPSPERRKIAPRTEQVQEKESTGTPPLTLILGIGTVLLAVGTLMALFITLMIVLASQGNEEDNSLNRERISGGVEIRDAVGEQTDRPVPETEELPVPERPPEPAVDPDVPVPVEGPAKLPVGVVPNPEPPPPVPVEAPVPQPPPAAIEQGTLKIRSNRRVLIYVDGRAIGYTPTEWTDKPGTYHIIAMMPGQPNTKQARDAAISAEHPTLIVDFSF